MRRSFCASTRGVDLLGDHAKGQATTSVFRIPRIMCFCAGKCDAGTAFALGEDMQPIPGSTLSAWNGRAPECRRHGKNHAACWRGALSISSMGQQHWLEKQRRQSHLTKIGDFTCL
jgi:hypothetical protein